jgi:pimeloyl-ACP methyl ester carboxylesterase
MWVSSTVQRLLFLIAAFRFPEPSHQVKYTQITNKLGMPLRVLVYTPQPAPFQPAPGAVICQPINDPPEYGRMLELEFVRDGFVVLTFDWRGRAPGEDRQLLHIRTQEALGSDVAAAVEYLRALPRVDPKRIVIAGHSVGGTLAINAALADPSLKGVAAIGMEADVSRDQPRNLLWAVGLYDEFRSLGHMRKVFEESAGGPAPAGKTLGDLERGTGRRLDVSPTADHFTELQDHRLQRSVLEWFHQVLGESALDHPMTMEVRAFLFMLVWLSVLAALLLTLRRAIACRADRVWVLRGVNTTAFLSTVALSHLHGRFFLELTDALTVLFLFVLFAGFFSTIEAETLERGGRWALRLALTLWLSLIATLVANALPDYSRHPQYLIYLPEFALRHALDAADAYLFDYTRPFVFSAYGPESVSLAWWVYALLGLEIMFPASLFHAVLRLVRGGRIGTRVEQRRISPASLVMFIALLAFLSGVVWLRMEQGFLTGDSARAAGTFLARYAVLPFFIFALVWRVTRPAKNQEPRNAGVR